MMRRSGWVLAAAGVVSAGFFWLTDPRFGLARWAGSGTENLVDASNSALAGTVVGIAGSAVVLLVGLWLVMRRAE